MIEAGAGELSRLPLFVQHIAESCRSKIAKSPQNVKLRKFVKNA